jgi:hypothetical protein
MLYEGKIGFRGFLISATIASVFIWAATVALRAEEPKKGAEDKGENQNGVLVFRHGGRPPLPEGLKADFEVFSRFGFKVVAVKIKKCGSNEVGEKRMWMAASEADYRKSEAQRLNIKPEDVPVGTEQNAIEGFYCAQTGPMQCNGGYCQSGSCSLLYNSAQHYYYCSCD